MNILMFAALAAIEIGTTAPGVRLCADLQPAPGDYYVRMVAADSEGSVSALSNQIQKPLPGEVCWVNPAENADGSPLADLVSVTILYDTSAIDAATVPRSPDPVLEPVVSCDPCASGVLIGGETNRPIRITWADIDGPYTVQVFEWPGGAVVLTADVSGGVYDWVPAKAGVYVVSVAGQTLSSAGNRFFSIKLAAPTGGGIE